MAKRNRAKTRSNIRHLITRLGARSPIAEQYRTIRTNVQFASIDEKMKSLMVTSSAPEEGKSSVIANLGVVFAQQGKRVLIIDGDMRKPTLHYTFQIDNRFGLSNVLVGDRKLIDVVMRSEEENLDLLPCGPIPPNPSELLGSKAMERTLNEVAELYDLVLFDTPPILVVTDAQILAGICDGAIMVVRSKQTEYEAVQKSRDLLKPAKAKFLGVILNDREQKKGNYHYYGTT